MCVPCLSGLCEDGPLSIAAHMSRLRAQLAVQASKRYAICMYVHRYRVGPSKSHIIVTAADYALVLTPACAMYMYMYKECTVHVRHMYMCVIVNHVCACIYMCCKSCAVSAFQPSDVSC